MSIMLLARPDYSQGSDGGSAGPFRCGKTQTYEGGFRVPTIFWWKEKIKTGRTNKVHTHMHCIHDNLYYNFVHQFLQ